MGASIEQIIATYPGISDDPDIALYIDLAKTQTSSSFYGTRYNEAVALRAAHNLVMSKPVEYASSMGAGIISKSQGGVRVDYGDNTGSSGVDRTGLAKTTYGQQLMALMRMSGAGIGVVGGTVFSGGVV